MNSIRAGGQTMNCLICMKMRELSYTPLFDEGFGIPLLEAMEFGCPVIASDGGSIPEVVGQAAKLFDGRDEEAMRAAMEEVLYDDAKRSALVESGRERCKVFSSGEMRPGNVERVSESR